MKETISIEPGPAVDGRIIKTAVSPRPIAWISTVDGDGGTNLAPFSSYNYVSSSPPVLVFHSGDKADGTQKDTARNAVETEEFVVNVVTEDVLTQMDKTADELPPEESEFDYADLESVPSEVVTPPRVADSVLSMECTLYDSMRVYDRTVVLGDVVRFHAAEEILTDGKVDVNKVTTIGRLGGPYYTAGNPLDFEMN